MDNYILESLERDSPSLVLGIAGCGDLTSVYMMKHKLESWKFDKVLYGNYQFILNAEICDFYNSSAIYVPFFEDLLEFIREDFLVISFQSGLIHTHSQFERILSRENIQYVLGINGGGNIFCSGSEKEILSPAIGALSLSLINAVNIINNICILGPTIGRTEVELQEISTKMFWFKTSLIYDFNPFTSLITKCHSIYEAYELINNWLAKHRSSTS
ncbi:MAG: DUF1152 domain-containing protein [Promethearchaeia archaeon]